MIHTTDVQPRFACASKPAAPLFSSASTPAAPAAGGLTPLSSAQAGALKSAVMFGASLPKFGHSVLNDRSVEMRVDTPLNARTVAKTLHALLFQHIAKGPDDKSSLKLQLNAYEADGYAYMDQAALADLMTFFDRPVDVIVNNAAGPASLTALQSASGKRLMTVGAELDMGPIDSMFASARKSNDDAQNYARLYASYLRDIEYQVMQRTGVTSREQVNKDLQSGKGLTSLDALAYGKTGLIDGILVGHDRVITRDDLDAYYAANGITTDKQKEQFNKNLDNVDLLASRPVGALSPTLAPGTEVAPFKSIKASKAADAAEKKEEKAKAEAHKAAVAEAEAAGQPAPPEPEAEKKFTINLSGAKGIASVDDIPGRFQIQDKKGEPVPDAYLLENVPAGLKSILIGDTINLSTGFGVDTAEKIVSAIRYLAQEKSASGDTSPIHLLVNSPGGAVIAGQEIRDAIASADARGVKTDVIAYGMASSCGSWTLSSASGSRLATPGSRVMIHQANGVPGNKPGPYYLANAAGLNQATETYQRIVAKASGRPYEEVKKDFRTDTWLNPIESLFYGPKGLIDGVLVGPDKVVTRDAVETFLAKSMGGRKKVRQAAEEAINRHREIETEFDVSDHDESDPFRNPQKTLQAIVEAGGATSFKKASLPQLQASSPTGEARDTMELFHATHNPGEED